MPLVMASGLFTAFRVSSLTRAVINYMSIVVWLNHSGLVSRTGEYVSPVMIRLANDVNEWP